EDELVVDLKDHPRAELTLTQLFGNPDHRQFDNVGCGSLNRRIDCGSFSHTAAHAVARIDFGMLPDSAKERTRDAGIARFAQAVFDIALHSLVLLEVFCDEICGFFRTDTQLLGESERRLAIDDSEVDCFCAAALL